jgi:hypothetical protein
LLDRRRHGFGQHFGARTGIDGRDQDLGRHDVRVLFDRKIAQREQAREHDDDRDDAREDRAADEEAGKHG